MEKGRFRLLATLMVLVVVLMAQGFAQDQDSVTITIWDQFFPEAQSDLMNEFIAEYQEFHPNVTINRSVFDTDSIRTVLRPALSSGEGPDIFYYDAGPAFLGTFADAGLVYDLSSAYERTGLEGLADWAVERVTYNGKVWGVPNEVEYTNVYYNRDVLEQLGMLDRIVPAEQDAQIQTLSSFQDFRDILQAAKDQGLVAIAFGNRDPGRGGHLFSYFVTLTAGKAFIDNILFGDGRWDTPEIIQALEIFKDFNDQGYYPPSANAISYDEANALFFAKQAATNITGTWLVTDILENVADPESVSFFLLPPVDEELPLSAAAGIGSAFAVSANSEHPDVAIDFLNFIMSAEAGIRWLTEGSVIVPRDDLDISGLELPAMTQMAVAGADLPHAYNLDVVMPAEWNDAMKNGLQALISGQASPEEVASNMQAAWETAKSEGRIWQSR